MADDIPLPSKWTLDNPSPLLRWLSAGPSSFSFDSVQIAEAWSLVALGTLGRQERPSSFPVQLSTDSATGRFAYAIGLEDVLRGTPPVGPGQEGRTVKLTRVKRFDEIEADADKIARLLFPGAARRDTALTIKYVLIELLRNVVQHSQDPLGGVVAAQLNDRGRNLERPAVQVAVGDAGVGVHASLLPKHPKLTSAQAALDRALWPHISGTFEEGESGTLENAGMGLFFIAEMTKLLAGTLLIASRGATLVLRGDPEFGDRHDIRFLESGAEFPGTLVAFEIPESSVEDKDGLFEVIRERARTRAPRRAIHRWLKFEEPPASVQRFLVQLAVENTGEALEFAAKHLLPRLMAKQPVGLDFRGIPVLTQSFLHSLLYEPLRVAWALRTEIYIVNAEPAVRSNLELLQNYALGG
ncbi:MAG TPA: hypothetical protein DFS52_32585 [Myxococcales bacterium]|nr:hypothetical protein [Myxococcales bacterium]